jgi:hypothetical protein
MKTIKKIMIGVGVFLLLLLITWGICETAGSDYYNYKGYVVDVIEENGDTILVTVSGNVESRFSLKWYSREKYKKDTKDIEIGDLVMLSTTHFSDTNIKKISVDYGYSTEGKLVYINELPDTPFILATDPTTNMKYLISIVPSDTNLFDGVEMGEAIRIYHTYPINAQTITVLSDAQALLSSGTNEELTEDEIKFVEEKGYTVTSK